jgi:hypothetical protein
MVDLKNYIFEYYRNNIYVSPPPKCLKLQYVVENYEY